MKTALTIHRSGMALVMTAVAIVILAMLGVGILTLAYGANHSSIRNNQDNMARLAAEAAYEKALYNMSAQPDMLTAIEINSPALAQSITLDQARGDYQISLEKFINYKPVYRLRCTGQSGPFKRTVEALVVQQSPGWAIGQAAIPVRSNRTEEAWFDSAVDVPVHINNSQTVLDQRDIPIKPQAQFLDMVWLGQSRFAPDGRDRYSAVMDQFKKGIRFNQPNNRITDRQAVDIKFDRFIYTTKNAFRFKPTAVAGQVPNPLPAVQIEFWVTGQGTGFMRITDNCTVRGFQQNNHNRTWDYKANPASPGWFTSYPIYAYHIKHPSSSARVHRVSESYVNQGPSSVQSSQAGQIFVDGNVIIGGSSEQVFAGNLTIAATGNIWIGDSIVLHGPRNADGMPAAQNKNALHLVAGGVIRVVDPGMTDPDYGREGIEPEHGPPYQLCPIGLEDADAQAPLTQRHLPNPLVIEAALTVGAGGFGAENLRRYRGGSHNYDGGRKHITQNTQRLIIRGTIVETNRAMTGHDSDGFEKTLYYDRRLSNGLLPGDMNFSGKFIPLPGTWQQYRQID